MKRIIGWGSVVIVALLLISPFFMGFMDKAVLIEMVARTNNSLKKVNGKAELEYYKRGWFTSTAKVGVVIMPPKDLTNTKKVGDNDTLKPVNLDLNYKIYHGPLLINTSKLGNWVVDLGQAAFHSTLTVNAKTNPEIADQLHNKPIGNSMMLATLTGAVIGDLLINPIKINNKNPAYELNWGGLNFKWRVSSDQKQVVTDINIQPLKITGQGLNIDTNTIKIGNNAHQDNFGNWLGTVTINIPKAIINSDPVYFSLTDFAFKGNSSEQNNLIDVVNDISLQQLTLGKIAYGPAILKFSTQNINAEAFAKFISGVKDLAKSKLPEQKQQHHQVKKLLDLYLNTLNLGPIIDLKQFELTLPKGVVKLSGKASINKLENEKQVTTKQLMDNAKVNLHFEAPSVIIKDSLYNWFHNMLTMQFAMKKQQTGAPLPSAEEQAKLAQQLTDSIVAKWIEKGMLIKDGDKLKFDAIYENSELKVNNKLLDENMDKPLAPSKSLKQTSKK